ncbi:cohesin subunit SA-3-like isoform X2 [Ctenocephalides felis]|uniref:cohesin subunit SA-3-like isoform X2 n=2 Tax=Ctenocephalides felis TaxID=7515 RepID=UPI000E6E3191|nr:cohesin subunit SA-3-like isoform X2 [Ctenocephalides felis]
MLINKYAEEYVFLKHWTGTHEEDQVQIKKRREVLERFCKLIEFGIIPVTSASFVLMYYVKCEKCYGDIIKKMVATMCSLSRTNCTTVMFLTLKENYLQVESSCAGDVVNKTIEGFVQLKTLAAHLAKFLGTNKLKNRQAVAKLHEAGILFAVEQSGSPNVPPHRLPFLEILTKFSAKLEEEDRSSVFKYLQSRSGIPSRIPSGAIWAPYRNYIRSLIGSKPPLPLNTEQRAKEPSQRPRPTGAAGETFPFPTTSIQRSGHSMERPRGETIRRYPGTTGERPATPMTRTPQRSPGRAPIRIIITPVSKPSGPRSPPTRGRILSAGHLAPPTPVYRRSASKGSSPRRRPERPSEVMQPKRRRLE